MADYRDLVRQARSLEKRAEDLVKRAKREAAPKFTCPECGEQNIIVYNSRGRMSYEGVWRRRKCQDCGYRFTTIERIVQKSA